MYYGHKPHVRSEDDLTLLKCTFCGWVSGELTRDEIAPVPWYCGGVCGRSGVMFIHFHPRERLAAYAAFGQDAFKDRGNISTV
jgi:hypothetical protein